MRFTPLALAASAALLVPVASASAADLPSRKAAPVEYVRICSAHGEGFFFIPGSDTCIRLGGRVRAEYLYVEPFFRAQDATGFRARGRLNVDSRTETAYGSLRAFFRYEITGDTGAYADGFGGSRATTVSLDKAFIQFAGITAGRLQSFFDFYANELNFADLSGSDAGTTNTLAYTATFGKGFSATIAIEDRGQRQVANGFPILPPGAQAFAPGGDRMPNVVANLRYDDTAFGSAQLSGAVAQLFSVNLTAPGFIPDTEYGFAIQGGVQINLPMFAAGDQLWLQAAYADGALSYLGVGAAAGVGGIAVPQADAIVDAFGSTKRTRGYALVGAYLHYWTPAVRQAVYASYARTDYAGQFLVTAGGINTGFVDTSDFRVGSNVIWSPVKDFDIGAEIFYTRVDPKGRVFDVNRGGLFTNGSADAIQGRLRFQRDF